MSIAHGAHNASPPLPLPLEGADGEPIGEGFEYIGERLTVLAVAARIMVRRHPGDVYARSIARETLRLAGAMREALHTEDTASPSAPVSVIVDTTLAPSAPSASAPPATSDSTDTTPATHHRGRGSARASSSSKQSPRSKTPARKGGAV